MRDPSMCATRSSTTKSSWRTCARAARSSSRRRSQIPVGATAVFSAHGVAPSVREEAAARELVSLDATCPLVSRVHAAVLRYAGRGYTILFVGHAGHPEVEGVMGEAPDQVKLIQTLEDADAAVVADPGQVAYSTQTTLSVDDVAGIVERLRQRFPAHRRARGGRRVLRDHQPPGSRARARRAARG